jgi:hypothetical protein
MTDGKAKATARTRLAFVNSHLNRQQKAMKLGHPLSRYRPHFIGMVKLSSVGHCPEVTGFRVTGKLVESLF